MKQAALFLLSLIPAVFATRQVVYLTNCYTASDGHTYSEYDYYSSVDNSHNGQYPDDNNDHVGNNYQWVHWEQDNSATFSDTGVTFYSNIESGAANYAVGQYAGYGGNGYTDFTCYRDNGQQLYYISGTADSCNKEYYCLSN